MAWASPALLIALTIVLTGAACWQRSSPDDNKQTQTSGGGPPSANGSKLFLGWPQPDFVLLLSAQQHGYILPCGCSSPQYGGLERRYNLVQELTKKRGWKVLALDLGDIPQMKGPTYLPNVQGLLKYELSMKALKKMGYTAVSFGEFEAAQPLTDAMDAFALNEPVPAVLAANLLEKATLFPDKDRPFKSYVGSWMVTQVTPDQKVGTIASIGPSVADKIKDNKIKFGPGNQIIPQALRQIQDQNADFNVFVYQGSLEEAKKAATSLKDFQVILCLSEEDEPPGQPVVLGNTFIIRLGHKSKHVGVVGVNRTNNAKQPFNLRYQLVTLAPEYQTRPEQEANHPILNLVEEYTRYLKDNDFLSKYSQGPHVIQFAIQQLPAFKGQLAAYAGSQACKKCHPHAFKVWQASAHSQAYQTLVNARRPSNRQYDGECVVCHTVGFAFRSGFANEKATPHLKDVGCESCHGPSQLHAVDPLKKELYPIINPWKAKPDEKPEETKKRLQHIEDSCTKCHDHDNDVHWTIDKWTKKEIIHMTPPEEK